MKTCPRCTIAKPIEDFPRDKSRRDGRFPYCKACNYEHSRQWVIDHPEQAATYRKQYRNDNPDVFRDASRDYMRRMRTTEAGRERQRNATRTKRARKRGGLLTTAGINARIAECGALCIYCGGPYTDIDHVIPVSRGGTDDPRNLVPACDSCNTAKGRRQWAAWFRRQRFYSEERERQIGALIASA